MKLQVLSADNVKKSEVTLPIQFKEITRMDLIKRCVLAENSEDRASYGVKPDAGMRHSAELSRRRKKYRGSYGLGISRVRRKIHSRRGTRFNWVGAVSPGTVGGRKAHPAKSIKIWVQKINNRERFMAVRSVISSVMNKEMVKQYTLPKTYPFVLSSEFNKISKTKTLQETLVKLGFEDEIKRASVKKIRAGKGKNRARPYKKKKSLVVVVCKDSLLMKSMNNIPGFDVVNVEDLRAKHFAPSASSVRPALFTEDAIEKIKEEKLYL